MKAPFLSEDKWTYNFPYADILSLKISYEEELLHDLGDRTLERLPR